jgi:IS5 family transposase
MKQQTLAMAADQCAGYAQHLGPKRRDEFQTMTNAVVPWQASCGATEQYCPCNGSSLIDLERILSDSAACGR